MKNPSYINEFIFKKHRTMVRQTINYFKAIYFKTLLNKYEKSSKAKWTLLNSIIKPPIHQPQIVIRKCIKQTNGISQSDIMYHHFADICTSQDTNIHYENHNIPIQNSIYLTKTNPLEVYTTFLSCKNSNSFLSNDIPITIWKKKSFHMFQIHYPTYSTTLLRKVFFQSLSNGQELPLYIKKEIDVTLVVIDLSLSPTTFLKSWRRSY